MAKTINTAVDALRTRLVTDCEESGLPVTIVNLIVTDLLNAVRAQEKATLAAEKEATNAQGHNPDTDPDA